jgi:hypothetical protein
MADDNKRLTYKSQFGDYGIDLPFREYHEIIHKVADRLGQYEDIGTPEEFRVLMIMHKEYMADKEQKPPTPLMQIFDEINESLDRITIRKEGQDGR